MDECLADKPQIAGLKASLELPAKDYLKAMRLRRLMQVEILRIFGTVDVLLAPGRAGIASKIDQPLDRGAGGTPPKDPRLPLHHSDGQSRRTPRPRASLWLR